jgi:5-deoxy-5-amino-3-dehydroquinate synthase
MVITVPLAAHPYEVVLDAGARHQVAPFLAASCPRAKVGVIVTSPSLRTMPWFDFELGIATHVIEVPDGESAKDFSTLARLCEQLANLQISRGDVIVGVGGGAITDLAGFAAAVYLRGIAVVQMPTSLVGQVDAAIGGKTAINLSAGKNLVGAFHQPRAVFCDFEMLATLAERERLSGLGEIAKCWLLEGRNAQELEATSLDDLIMLAVQLKADIVAEDEFESGRRALLNYGHTLGHAVEVLALARDANELRHGEAVALGLAYAARLAHRLGRVDGSAIANHDQVLASFGLGQLVPDGLSTDDIVNAMGHDKKAHHDFTFVLAGADGFDVVRGVDRSIVVEVLESFRGEQ